MGHGEGFKEHMLGFTFKTNILECSFGTPIFGMWGERGCGALNNIFLFSIFLNTNWSLLYWIKFKGYVHNDTFAYDMYEGYFIEKSTFFASPSPTI